MIRLRVLALVPCVAIGLALGHVADSSAADIPLAGLRSVVPAGTTLPAGMVVTLSSAASLANRTWMAWDPSDYAKARSTAVPRLWSYDELDSNIAARGSVSGADTQDISVSRSWALHQWTTITDRSLPADFRQPAASRVCSIMAHEVGHRFFGHTDEADGATTNTGRPWAGLMDHNIVSTAPGCDDWATRLVAFYTLCSTHGLRGRVCFKVRHANKKIHAHAFNWRTR